MDVDSLLAIDNCIDDFFAENPRERPLVMFGAGFALAGMLAQFARHGIEPACICDNAPSKQGQLVAGRFEVISLDDCQERFPSALYVISSPTYFWEIKRDLEARLGAASVCGIDFGCAHYFTGNEFKSFFAANSDRYQRLHENLCDEFSKQTLERVVRAHLSGRREDFEAASTGDEDWYLFRSLLQPRPDSVYVDCGAYDGDTVKLFQAAAGDGYASIIALEPDATIHAALESAIADEAPERVELIQKGAYDFNGTLQFIPDGVYSQVSDANQSAHTGDSAVEIEVATLDSLLAGRAVDIIKMDIEGAEYRALQGARETISQHRPRLAICLYHNKEDFVDIPELLLEMVPEYRLELRHQSRGCTDTILFASLQ